LKRKTKAACELGFDVACCYNLIAHMGTSSKKKKTLKNIKMAMSKKNHGKKKLGGVKQAFLNFFDDGGGKNNLCFFLLLECCNIIKDD
jgi:hypothetical protein